MLNPGDVIGNKLRIIRQLGAGGMGVVFEAEQVHLARRVAVKLIHPADSKSLRARERFIQEARALAQLPLEHIVQVLDVDTLPGGGLYMVMEYLEGRDLKRELFKRGPLPPAEAVGYVVQACEGVAAAHEAGIIHRDIKPQNLFVTHLAGKRRVKLLDFGVAKMLAGPDVGLTGSTALVGTPVYMSPEQLSGRRPLDGQSDLWALGTVLYELLTGSAPFRRESAAATLAAVLVDTPDPLHEKRDDLPEGLEPVVMRCLAKDPSARFATARELAAALAPYAPLDSFVSPSRQAPRGSSAPPSLLGETTARLFATEPTAATVSSFRVVGREPGSMSHETPPLGSRAEANGVETTVASRRPATTRTRRPRAVVVIGLVALSVGVGLTLTALLPKRRAGSVAGPRAALPSLVESVVIVPLAASSAPPPGASSIAAGASVAPQQAVVRGVTAAPAGTRVSATASVPVAPAPSSPTLAGDAVPLHL